MCSRTADTVFKASDMSQEGMERSCCSDNNIDQFHNYLRYCLQIIDAWIITLFGVVIIAIPYSTISSDAPSESCRAVCSLTVCSCNKQTTSLEYMRLYPSARRSQAIDGS